MNAPIATEHQEQVALIEWWAHAARSFGLTNYHLFAIPNAGAGASRGQAGKMKAEGARSGIPDLFLAVARGGWHGLFIEMKREGGRASDVQLDAMRHLSQQRYLCVIAFGAEQAMSDIKSYLGS